MSARSARRVRGTSLPRARQVDRPYPRLSPPLVGALLALAGLGATPAGATTFHDFGNATYNDCGYEAMANLTLARYPAAHITTAQVLRAWRAGNAGWDSSITYAQTVGFGGHRLTGRHEIPITDRGALIRAANHGGVWATVLGGNHAVGFVRANLKGVWLVDDHADDFYTWAALTSYEEMGMGPGELAGVSYVALTWPASPAP